MTVNYLMDGQFYVMTVNYLMASSDDGQLRSIHLMVSSDDGQLPHGF